MRRDERGVGGFIEDVPVLVFVLAGVLTLVGTGAWAAEQKAGAARDDALRSLASDTMDRVLWALSDGVDETMVVGVLAGWNASWAFTEVPEGIGWLLSVDMLHPNPGQLILLCSDAVGTPADTASDSRLVNAECDGMCALVRVTVVVWSL